MMLKKSTHLMVYGNYRRGSLLVNLIGRALEMKRKITHKSLLHSVFAVLLLLSYVRYNNFYCSHTYMCTFDELMK